MGDFKGVGDLNRPGDLKVAGKMGKRAFLGRDKHRRSRDDGKSNSKEV